MAAAQVDGSQPQQGQPDGSVNVTQHHNDDSRDGLFIDSAFTPAAAAGLTRDMSFNGVIVGNVYAQPLYIENGPGGQSMVIAVTESNNVYAAQRNNRRHYLAAQHRSTIYRGPALRQH